MYVQSPSGSSSGGSEGGSEGHRTGSTTVDASSGDTEDRSPVDTSSWVSGCGTGASWPGMANYWLPVII